LIRVLLADDQALVRSGFRSLLDAQEDIQVVGEAGDGDQAVELTSSLIPDVVLMDVRMPGADGLDATRRIRADQRLRDVRIVILTTFELDEYVFEALRIGASGFLVKDTDPADLIRAVREAARGEALLSPSVTRRLIGQFAGQSSEGRVVATVLFTDIVGSTERAREIGDRRWRELLDRHDELAGRVVEGRGGRLIKNTGDGVFATFDRPASGIRTAVVLRDELRDLGIEIRAGLHTGEVELRGGDVGGIAVHIGARVMAEAGPGEVVASRTVRDLVVGSDVAFEDRGIHRLKGMEDEWQLFAVTRA